VAAAVALPLLWWLEVLDGVEVAFASIDLVYLFVFADNVEDRLGGVQFAAVALAAGLAGVLTAYLFSSPLPIGLVAASATVAGVIGGYLSLYPTSRVLLLVPVPLDVHEVPAVFVAGLFFTLQATGGPLALATIAAGGVTGALLSFGLKRPLVW
jgi:membrane associated rhomboid family serine protease